VRSHPLCGGIPKTGMVGGASSTLRVYAGGSAHLNWLNLRRSDLQLLFHHTLDPLQHSIFGEGGGVEEESVGSGHQGRCGAGAVTAVAFAQFCGSCLSGVAAQMLLLQAALFADHGIRIEKDLDVSMGKNRGRVSAAISTAL